MNLHTEALYSARRSGSQGRRVDPLSPRRWRFKEERGEGHPWSFAVAVIRGPAFCAGLRAF
jgi:hypothetical protein